MMFGLVEDIVVYFELLQKDIFRVHAM